jgi:hypothetical protein
MIRGGGLTSPFLFGGNVLEYVVCFIFGMIISWVFNYIMGLGYSVLLLRQAQKSCAALLLASDQGLQQVLHLKYLALEESDRSQQNITAQKYIDQLNIDSVKKTIMKNYVLAFPRSYENILEYKTWEEMENFVDKTLKEEQEGK